MPELILWLGTVGQAPFRQRVAAAASSGCTALSVLPGDCTGSSPSRLRALAADAGVRVAVLDPITTWIPEWSPQPGWTQSSARISFAESFAAHGVEESLRIASALGCTSVSLIEPYGRRVPVDRGAEALASVCERAADYGLNVALEAMPFSGVADVATAWSIVAAAGCRNGGLVLDTWHFFRGGGDLGLLATVPVDRLFAVQLSDAPMRPQTDLYAEALEERLLPGEGELNLSAVVEALYRRGFCGLIGPEVVSARLHGLHPVVAARRAADACRALLDVWRAP